MRLLLIRHGESICGVNGIVGGERGCTGLTERGLAQARALRDRLTNEAFAADVIYTSTLPRAVQTAEIVADGLGLPPEQDPNLREFIPGEMDGTPWEAWDRFDVSAEPDRPMSPGGESLNVFKARVAALLDRFAADHPGQTVVAVCHGGVIGTSIYRAFGIPDGLIWADIDFTSITEWRREEERWRLVRFNDVAHLMGGDLLVRT